MNARERVLTALNHEEPDRVPIDLGGSVVTSIAVSTYAKVRELLHLPETPVRILETVQQIAWVDDDLLDILGADVIPVFANPPDNGGPEFIHEPDGAVSFKDGFGATLRKPQDGYYYEWQAFPLAEPSVEALQTMAWPDPCDPGLYRGLREQVRKRRDCSDKALFGMAPCGHDLFNQIFRVRGMAEGLMDLVAAPDFAEAFFDRLTDTICMAQAMFLAEVGDLIDVHFAGDDLAGQAGPLIAPALYRRMIKPRQARIIETIKAGTRAKIFYHTCGAVTEFIDDLVDLGVDVLNPVQVTAAGMEAAALKKRYGARLSFWGGGCDTQQVLWQGTPAAVRADVQRRIQALAPGGGYVFNPVHNIQPQVPAANVAALFSAAREYGRYPVRGC